MKFPPIPFWFPRPLRADLHLHSTMSDGKYAPESLVELAVENGIQILSLTDHDTVQGVKRARDRARELGCLFINGVELEATVKDTTGQSHIVHILGYGIDPDDSDLRRFLKRVRKGRVKRARRILKNLRSMGVNVPFQRLRQKTEGECLSRVHIAQTMKNMGHVSSIDQAFEQFLGNHAPAYVPHQSTSPGTLIELIHAAGGTAVWAHPYYSRNDELLHPLLEAGLDGIECFHSNFPAEVSHHYEKIAHDHGLMVTGGSDFHGTMEEGFNLGDWCFEMDEMFLPLSVGPGDLNHRYNGS